MARKRVGPFTIALLSSLATILIVVYPCAGLTGSQRTVTRNNSRFLTHSNFELNNASTESSTSTLREIIPAKYHKRYLRWRNDFLSTASGHEQWERYSLNPGFTLTITVSPEEAEGARVMDFIWDDSGKLSGATIILGSKLDSGYPSSITYPITCSLAPGNLPPEVKGTILAATKLAHEFGDLNRTMSMDGRLYQLQNNLMIEYNKFFYANGRDTSDPYLLELSDEMGGTPVSIKQDRESWAEMGAILYLQERLRRDHRLKMPQPIRQAIETYFVTYPGRML